ncbi:MAG: exodeoxyribonuclease V subunit gamma, partial [Verrucomicrobia bacterium]|nr:exodeoxyribonuclease V subunit gamma [Verrucomicrobiota bacterium]
MIPTLFFSQSLDPLVDRLVEEWEASMLRPMQLQTILVPNGGVRQWLLLEIAKRKGIAMGLRVLEPGQFFPSSKSSLDLFCSVYDALPAQAALVSYLDGKPKRRLELTAQLASLFAKYEQYGPLLKTDDWQTELFHTLVKPQDTPITEPIFCFGIDFLTPLQWKALSTAPALSLFLFSPCTEFWEDLCSDRERKAWQKRNKKITIPREGPRHLANWGRLGRITLKTLDDFAAEELYTPVEPTSLLKQIQVDLLLFQETKDPKQDDSIAVLQTGSSRLAEIEALKEEILRLDVPYHEISVLAPDLEPYIPLIKYVFGEEIPYRIEKMESSQSSFKQGLLRLLKLGSGRWSAEDILSLFETPSFYRKKGWDAEVLETFRSWIETIQIDWGLNDAHQRTVLQDTLGALETAGHFSWETGLDRLLETLVYLKPMQINPDLFEEFLEALTELQTLCVTGTKTLSEWADTLQKAEGWFKADSDEDTNAQTHFHNLLLEMRQSAHLTQFPFEVVHHFLTKPCYSQCNGAQLHAVRFAPLEEGAILPARALFLIGMDEMSFPRVALRSSLDLLQGKIPSQKDFDRYTF